VNPKTNLIRLKIERAKHHIRDLDARSHSYFESHACFARREQDPQTREYVWRACVEREIPSDFPTIIGDILQNLRASLDHLAWQLVLSNGQIPTKATGFPIFETLEVYKIRAPKKVKGMAQGAIDLIDAFKPYGGGNEDLWGLHVLNNSDKHRLLLVVGAVHVSTSIDVNKIMPYPAEALVRLPPRRNIAFPLDHGTELLRIRSGELEEDPQFAFNIMFGDAQIMNGEPLLPPLDQLSNLIDSIILGFDRFLI
jgi:hypothetical protein